MESFFNALRSNSLRRGPRRMLGGVLGGIADRLDVDVVFVRILFIVLCFLPGPAVLAYLVAWAIIPDQNGSIVLENLLGGPRITRGGPEGPDDGQGTPAA